ncbi:unnamed protein product [Nesidiocoris tenuis]|uniref:BTB domain-containing protein n=1 Tax=Nesidiocoris tenuis TaxID=355587 RepID=A0A6H5HEG8_9HEMI|nr:unnamed protein product [Nesidiocoris tenuis]
MLPRSSRRSGHQDQTVLKNAKETNPVAVEAKAANAHRASSIPLKIAWDCTESCRAETHATQIAAVISKKNLNDHLVAYYLLRTCRRFSRRHPHDWLKSYDCSLSCEISNQMRIFLEQANEFDSLHDVLFVAGSLKMAAHRFVLLSRGCSYAKVYQNVIIVPSDIPALAFKALLTYLYCGSPIALSCIDHEESLLIASDQYLIDDLKDTCAQLLSRFTSLKNCAMILQLAITYNVVRLKNWVGQFILHNLCAVIQNRSKVRRL